MIAFGLYRGQMTPPLPLPRCLIIPRSVPDSWLHMALVEETSSPVFGNGGAISLSSTSPVAATPEAGFGAEQAQGPDAEPAKSEEKPEVEAKADEKSDEKAENKSQAANPKPSTPKRRPNITEYKFEKPGNDNTNDDKDTEKKNEEDQLGTKRAATTSNHGGVIC